MWTTFERRDLGILTDYCWSLDGVWFGLKIQDVVGFVNSNNVFFFYI